MSTAHELIKVWDIPGGVHPPENKHQSNQTAIAMAGIPDELIFPLSQHIGAPAAPVVELGQQVLKGQMIAAAKGFVSVPIHASTSGTVTAIEDRTLPHPSGMTGPCIVITPDQKDEWIELEGVDDYTQVEKTELIERIRNAGIAGMGGAGFPSAVKLSTRPEHSIDTLIINGTECEPYITADDRLMRERADQVIKGTQILQHIIQASDRVVIGVEDNKPEGIEALRAAAEGTDIQVVSFPTKYPSGGEKQLIQIITGREVHSGGLPADIGIVCQNIGSTVAIYKAITFGEPLISRITTVTGEACDNQQNFEVLLGTPFRYLLSEAGFHPEKNERLVMGGPMMGFSIEDPNTPIVKTTNCILAPTPQELPSPPPAQACIRCGMCAQACPASLLPQQLFWFAQGKEYEKLEAHNLMDCIECGACSFVCPSNIPLVQYYRASKAEIRHQKQEHEKAEHSKLRFEARQQRIEKEKAEKEAKRIARAEAAKAKAAKGASNDVVQAAIERAKAKKDGADSPAEIDPAQLAIEKAKAKRSGDAPAEVKDKASLEKAVATAEKRLNAAQEKLAQAEADNAPTVEAMKTAVEKMQSKLDAAKQELDNFTEEPAPAPVTTDPAQLAIEKAKAKRAGTAAAEVKDKDSLQKAVNTAEKRLSAAQEKLAQAEADNAPTVDAMKTAVEKMQTKLDAARQELESFVVETVVEQQEDIDPAKAAIERAMANRAAQASLSDEEKAKQKVISLESRLAKTEQKLAAAREEQDPNEAILTDTVEKLRQKLDQAKAELADKA